MKDIIIRQTESRDIPALKDVLNQTELFPAEMLADMLAPALTGDAQALWRTAERDGAAVGFAYTVAEELAEGTWNMLALGVLPARQGQGVGAALVAETIRHLQTDGQRLLIVDTSSTEDFAGARGFYAAQGFDEEARIRDYWAAGDDKVTFRKAL